MARNKMTGILALAALLFIAIASPIAAAQQPAPTQESAFCTSLYSTNAYQGGLTFYSLNGLITIATIIMLMMAALIGILFAIGYSFKIDRLTRFARAEVGEIIITALVIYIFLGTFSATNLITSSSSLFSAGGTILNDNIFVQDCQQLSGAAFEPFPSLLSLISEQNSLSIFSTLYITSLPGEIGIRVAPLLGLTPLVNVLSLLSTVGFGLLTVMLALAALPMIFYVVFPIFLFAGIALRTLPFTRAAGGAFIGLFASFYIVFPLLIYYTLSLTNVNGLATSAPAECFGVGALTPPTSTSITGLVNNVNFANPTAFLPSPVEIFGGFGYVFCSFMTNVLAPSLFDIMAIVVAMLVSFDLVQFFGQLLGAPSLQSRHTLRNVI